MLLVLAMKCCTKMPCPLPHNHCLLLLAIFTYMLASPAHLYMPHLFTHCLPTIMCVDVYCVFFIFAICYISLWLHFGLFVNIFSLLYFTFPFFYAYCMPDKKKLFLSFSFHCSTQNISFSDSGYVTKPPQLSSEHQQGSRGREQCDHKHNIHSITKTSTVRTVTNKGQALRQNYGPN